MTISHNILTGGDWGCIYLRASSPTIVNNAFAYAYPVGMGAIMCTENSSPIIENNIFFENNRPAIEHDETSTPIVRYNDFYGNWDDDIYAGVNGNISEDPLFVNPQRPEPDNPESYDFHLQQGSPCIDAGNPESDFCNEPQPNGCRIDMGAYGNTPEATISDTQCGDVSGNGKVSAYDAALVLRHVVGLEELTQDQIQRADVSGNGAITAYDAALILRYTVGLINKFPIESCSAAPILAMNKSYELSFANVSAKAGDRITLPIRIADATSIFAGELTLDYNSTILKPINFSTTDLTKEYSLVHNAEAGKLKISFAGLESLRGSGNLVNIEFEAVLRHHQELK